MEIPGIIDVNGEYKYVSSERDLCDIIEKHCGHEVANIVATICNNCDAAGLRRTEGIHRYRRL